MAKAKGFIKLSGSLGDTTFKKVGKENYAQYKISISKERMKNHPKFASLRRNGKQWGNASQSAKAIRFALNSFVHYCEDPKMAGRLNAEMIKVVKRDFSTDAYSRGMVARAENMEMLLGFDFNEKVRLRATFNVAFNTDVNRETGEVKINIASFKPASAVKAPRLAKQFAIMASVADINFDPAVGFGLKYQGIPMYSSDPIILDDTPTEPMSITFNVKPGHVNTIFIALGVYFLDTSNPLYADINSSRRVSSGRIVGIDAGATVPFVGAVANE